MFVFVVLSALVIMSLLLVVDTPTLLGIVVVVVVGRSLGIFDGFMDG